jgi:hypothetical protein
MKRKDENDIDLCACYEPTEPIPEEFIDPDERKPTLEDSSIYMIAEDGTLYYFCGNTRIKVTEHFAETGKTLSELMEEMVLREAKKATNDNALNR